MYFISFAGLVFDIPVVLTSHFVLITNAQMEYYKYGRIQHKRVRDTLPTQDWELP